MCISQRKMIIIIMFVLIVVVLLMGKPISYEERKKNMSLSSWGFGAKQSRVITAREKSYLDENFEPNEYEKMVLDSGKDKKDIE